MRRYPNNPVLKVITPQATCRNMDVYPVKLTQEAISVDVSGAVDTGSSVPRGKGGADSSADNNNVFSDDSKPYYEGQDPLSKLLFLFDGTLLEGPVEGRLFSFVGSLLHCLNLIGLFAKIYSFTSPHTKSCKCKH